MTTQREAVLRLAQAQAVHLATRCGWYAHEADPASNYTVCFLKQGGTKDSVIYANFSPTGRLTRLEGLVFVDNSLTLRSVPARDKKTRISHWLTEGIN